MEKDSILIIFGASGDLAKRKLIPAFTNLLKNGLIGKNTKILGVGRTYISDEDFRDLADYDRKDDTFFYQQLDTEDPLSYMKLKERLSLLDSGSEKKSSYIFYLAVPPLMYSKIIDGLCHVSLNISDTDGKNGYKRIVIEKPFGSSLETAVSLNRKLHEGFSEEQIFRIDHYLGKETVQNILAFRFSNGIFEPLWNRNYISYVEITAAESIGIEKRGRYYERSGALRDMVQNHLLQLTAIAAMEPPSLFNADSMRSETLKVFQALRPYKEDEIPLNVIKGQYSESVIRGEKVKGYREEDNVSSASRTETFAALRVYIDNWRWGGVPFYLRTGKMLPSRVSEIVIHFKPTPNQIFSGHSAKCSCENILILRIQPDEGVLMTLGMKKPGGGFEIQEMEMDFKYSDISDTALPDAYERLLYDIVQGDQTLFTRSDGVEECWKFIDPVINYWEKNQQAHLFSYPAGTWGPEEAEDLIKDTGSGWRHPCKNLTETGMYCEL